MNINKNRPLYDSFVKNLSQIASGSLPNDFDKLVDRMYVAFLDGFRVSKYPNFDYGAQVVKSLQQYSSLVAGRKKVDISESKREITMESESYEALVVTSDLIGNLILPHIRNKTNFSNKLFHELYNLGFSCLEAIVSGISDEYIDRTEATAAKLSAVELAKATQRAAKMYFKNGNQITYALAAPFEKFNSTIESFPSKHLRPFETVTVSPKEIARKEEVIRKIIGELMSGESRPEFTPHIICPIAQGGNELGIVLANAYEDHGHSPIVYPLMYSIKTRKQRHPWIAYDGDFLTTRVNGKDVLLTEDWVTTGNTVRGILNELEGVFPHEMRVATLKRDPEQSNVPILDKYGFYVGMYSKYTGGKVDTVNSAK